MTRESLSCSQQSCLQRSCPYKSCKLGCSSADAHRAKYAVMYWRGKFFKAEKSVPKKDKKTKAPPPSLVDKEKLEAFMTSLSDPEGDNPEGDNPEGDNPVETVIIE